MILASRLGWNRSGASNPENQPALRSQLCDGSCIIARLGTGRLAQREWQEMRIALACGEGRLVGSMTTTRSIPHWLHAPTGWAFRAASRRFSGAITRVDTQQPVVALTFDDGPNPDATPDLLELLADYRAKATFFMVGEHAAAYPALVEQVRKAGHAIGNHTWSHPSLPLISPGERREQLRKCAEVLRAGDVKLLRPPYGHHSAWNQWEAWWQGYQVITWDVCLPDWEAHDAKWFAELALQQVNPGSIVLMHDGLFDYPADRWVSRTATLAAVEHLLRGLAGSYRCVTVPEMEQCGRVVRENWWMRPDVNFLNHLTRRGGRARRYSNSCLSSCWIGYNR